MIEFTDKAITIEGGITPKIMFFSEDGSKLITRSHEEREEVWCVHSGDPVLDEPGKPFLPHTTWLYEDGNNSPIRTEHRNGKRLFVDAHGIQLNVPEWFSSDYSSRVFAVSPNERYLAIGSSTGRIQMFDKATGEIVRLIGYNSVSGRHSEDNIRYLEFDHTSKFLFSIAEDPGERIWDLSAPRKIHMQGMLCLDESSRGLARTGIARLSPSEPLIATCANGYHGIGHLVQLRRYRAARD